MRTTATITHATITILFISAICSCSRVQYVPVETVRRDSVVQVVERRDSIHVTDSISVVTRGDTVWRDRWRTIYKEVARRDTIYKETRDTVAVPYPVERRATFWDKAKGWAAGIAVVVLLGGGLAWLLRRTLIR